MLQITKMLSAACCLLAACSVYAMTWDEPWHEEVVRTADSLALAQILQNDGEQVRAKLVKQLAGASVPAEFVISEFSLLRLTSMTAGHEPRFGLREGGTYYLFLKQGKKAGAWALPTPTTGYAVLDKDEVTATYRHSYHMALVKPDIYERTQTAIFQHLHAKPYDAAYIEKFMTDQLAELPQNIPADVERQREQAERFFNQHAALECFYYFGLERQAILIGPFLASDSYHVPISAARALSAINSAAGKKRLLDFVQGKGNAFAKVMAVWGLKRLNAREHLPQLLAYAEKSAGEEAGFGGSIMDPRVGTHFPASVKAAIQELAQEWQSKPAK